MAANTVSIFTFNRIVHDTIDGEDLRIREANAIAKLVHFNDDEKIEKIYMFDANFEKYFEPTMKILVGITNLRIFKIDKGIVSFAMISDITNIHHIAKSIFRWDQLVCTLKDGTTIEFGIYTSVTAKYFMNYLKSKLRK